MKPSQSDKISAQIKEIVEFKQIKKVTFFAHYYQRLEIQKCADIIGDSLELAKNVKNNTTTPNILFAGVRFMAETASILNQDKCVYSPDPSAGCPLADSLTPKIIEIYRKEHPKSPLVVYINTTAETKAVADVCCTSSNAIQIVEKAAREWNTDTILFGPDKNLAAWVESKTKLKIIKVPGTGACPYHDHFTVENVTTARKKYPQAVLLVHPESPMSVLEKVDFVGPTSAMVNYVKTHPNQKEFVIGTEVELLSYLQDHFPQQIYYPLSDQALCRDMKKITMEKILTVMKSIGSPAAKKYEIRVNPKIADLAIKSIEKMLKYSN